MIKTDKCKMLCGLLFIIIVVILVIAIFRKGKLWSEENYNFLASISKDAIALINRNKKSIPPPPIATSIAAPKSRTSPTPPPPPPPLVQTCTTEKLVGQCFYGQGSANCKKICETADLITCKNPDSRTVKSTERSQEVVSWNNCV